MRQGDIVVTSPYQTRYHKWIHFVNILYEEFCMPSDLPRLTVRMEQELIDKINVIAKKENRSTNQQITYIIKKYIEQYEQENGRLNNLGVSVSKTG